MVESGTNADAGGLVGDADDGDDDDESGDAWIERGLAPLLLKRHQARAISSEVATE